MDQSTKRTNVYLIDVLILAVIGAAIRLVDLGTSPFWRDEAVSAFWADLPVGELINALQADVHAPLYYILLSGWAKLFGDGEWAQRSFGAILGGFTPAALYWALAGTFRRAIGLAAGVLLAVNPGHILYSQQVSVYALWVLLGACAIGLTLRMIRADDRRTVVAIGLGLTSSAMMYTHMWTALFWSALMVAVGIASLIKRRATGRMPAWTSPFAAAQIGGLILFLPWLIPALRQAESRTMDHLPPTPPAAWILVESAGFWFNHIAPMVICAAVLVIGGAMGIRRLRRSPHSNNAIIAVILLASIVLIPHVICLIVSPIKMLYYPRYTIVCIPALLALTAWAAMQFGNRIVGAVLIAAIAVSPMVSGVNRGLCIASTVFAPSPLRDVARRIDDAAEAGDVIVIYPEFYAATFNWYYRGDLPQVCYPALGRVELMDWHSYPARIEDPDSPQNAVAYVTEHLGDGGKIWVIYNPEYKGHRSGIDYGDSFIRFLRGLDQVVPNIKRTDDTFSKGRRFNSQSQSWVGHAGQLREPVIVTVCIPTGADQNQPPKGE